MDVLVALIIGGIAGWLAGMIMKADSGGLILNILLGIAGGFVGNWLFAWMNISLGSGWIGSILTATIGAAVLILIVRLIRGGR